MLTGITLENFKAFKAPQFIPIKPITLVFGPNSAGKSSIIHALAFLKQVRLTKGHCDPEGVEFGWSRISLGSWQHLVFGHDVTRTMRITLHAVWYGDDESHGEEAIGWNFVSGAQGSRVDSFEISNNGTPTARGKNVADKGIQWKIELHSSHPIVEEYRKELWNLLLGDKADQRFVKKDLLDNFSTCFNRWKEREWHPMPESYRSDSSETGLFPSAPLFVSQNFHVQFLEPFPFSF